MSFWLFDHRVKWFGVGASTMLRLFLIAACDLVSLLLDEFRDVFKPPMGLPPSHRLDHRIHLLPDAPPVVVQPYRYPQLLKDEIECQCEEMLR